MVWFDDEPLTAYRERFKDEFANRAAALFEDMLIRSGVDESANAVTMATIREFDCKIADAAARNFRLKALRIMAWLYVASAILAMIITIQPWSIVASIVALPIVALVIEKLSPAIKSRAEHLGELTQCRTNKEAEAHEQVAPLNAQYEWLTFVNLVNEIVPGLVLDPYVSRTRVDDLVQSFKWEDASRSDRSFIFAQSGGINGNPFVIAETLNYSMGRKTYSGSIKITWRELKKYKDSKGRTRTRWVTRNEILTAQVEKPAPTYRSEKFVIFGNEAAPSLTFTRKPSRFSESGDMAQGQINRTVRKLERRSRKLKEGNDFTIMANREFEALFNAIDRNDEIQYRVLFTPLAQQQMVRLLRDGGAGYGDNFRFVKKQMINEVYPKHLENIDISADPVLFSNIDVAAARAFFNRYAKEYFRSIYFALAPLATIPAYQQHRTRVEIDESTETLGDVPLASHCEYEAIANFHGQRRFAHPESVTNNILKTQYSGAALGGGSMVAVTAHGYKGVRQITKVARRGGDGKMYDIPVEWIEYVAVQQTTMMTVRESADHTRDSFNERVATSDSWQKFMGASSRSPMFRRGVASYVGTPRK